MFARFTKSAGWKQAAAFGSVVGLSAVQSAGCSDDHIPALDYGWSHHGEFNLLFLFSLDTCAMLYFPNKNAYVIMVYGIF